MIVYFGILFVAGGLILLYFYDCVVSVDCFRFGLNVCWLIV